MDVLSRVQQEILSLLQEVVGPEIALVRDQLTQPPNPEMGDIAFGCFPLAKAWGKSPAGVADDLAGLLSYRLSSLGPDALITKVTTAGPYLNFWLNTRTLGTLAIADIKKVGTKYGSTDVARFLSMDSYLETRLEALRNSLPGRRIAHEVSELLADSASLVRGAAARVRGKTAHHRPVVMIEVCSPNTHKEIHIGHLRNILLGRSIVQLRRALGEQVIPASFLEDLGSHVAKTLWAYEKQLLGKDAVQPTGQYLGKLYTAASRAIDELPNAKEEVSAMQHRLETKEKTATALWKKTRQWSIKEIQGVFAELGVPVRKFYFDSDLVAEGKRAVEQMKKSGVAVISEGATGVDLSDEGLGFFLILKSDGTTLYATKDLALIRQKFREYDLDRAVVVVDTRQSLYFKQLFATFKRMGITQEMVHVPFDFVTLKGGTMSSRKGNIITYEDFRDEVVARAQEETKKRHPQWRASRIKSVAWDVARGAMAVGMLKQDNDRQIVFDMEEALSFEGFTGPYVQYSLARLITLQKKVKGTSTKQFPDDAFSLPPERQLVYDLARYPEIVRDAAEQYRPTKVMTYLFELTKHVSEFYEKVQVGKGSPAHRTARLALLHAVETVMRSAFHILGIPEIEEM